MTKTKLTKTQRKALEIIGSGANYYGRGGGGKTLKSLEDRGLITLTYQGWAWEQAITDAGRAALGQPVKALGQPVKAHAIWQLDVADVLALMRK